MIRECGLVGSIVGSICITRNCCCCFSLDRYAELKEKKLLETFLMIAIFRYPNHISSNARTHNQLNDNQRFLMINGSLIRKSNRF